MTFFLSFFQIQIKCLGCWRPKVTSFLLEKLLWKYRWTDMGSW